VAVINRTYHMQKGLKIEAEIYSVDGKKIHRQVQQSDIGAPEAKKVFSIASVLQNNTGVNLILLRLKDASGKLISHNTYWLEATHNYRSLQEMPAAKISTTILGGQKKRETYQWKIKFTNSTDKIAFFIHPALLSGETEVRPAFWQDNYFSLGPGETIITEISVPARLVKGGNLKIVTSGLNVSEMELPVIVK
jgi:Exo-beta-D-glucosaminidase Ig-fold domain